jgi:hypothetical protein
MMSKPLPSVNKGRLVLLAWLLVAFFYFYLSYDYIRVTMNDDDFKEYLDYVVPIAGQEHRPAKEIRQLILVKADELGLPVRGEDIIVLGGGDNVLSVSVVYDVDIQIPVFERGIYKKLFQHKVVYNRDEYR